MSGPNTEDCTEFVGFTVEAKLKDNSLQWFTIFYMQMFRSVEAARQEMARLSTEHIDYDFRIVRWIRNEVIK